MAAPRTRVAITLEAEELQAIHRRIGHAAPLSNVSRFVRGALLMRLAFHDAAPLERELVAEPRPWLGTVVSPAEVRP